MRQEIELYLGGRSVEFNEPPEILFSYIRTDYTDPTVLRNSYSKTLTIEGTPNNNQIFNSIYHLDKISDYGTFNPAKRMDFQLFSNGDILEQGYAKLDKINKNEKNITYDITLYGGLGEFLYNLSYDQTAEGSDTSRGGGEDRRLSSLVFYDETEPNKEFDFDITKETIAEAWEALEKGTGATKWQYINFAPAYNGYPEDFDADKVLINTTDAAMPLTYNNNGTVVKTNKGFPTSIVQSDTTYRTYNNYALGELPKEMTEWEMRDLRSYLQRPVMSMKGFIQAISRPENNGGYTVDLDPRFFSNTNPYYNSAWVTLPMLKKDETEVGQSAKTEVANNVLSVSSIQGDSYDSKYYLQGLQPGATYQGLELSFQLSVDIAGMPDQVMTTAMDYNAYGWPFALDAGYYSSIFVQMVGEDENGNAIAASPIYNFTSPYGSEAGFKFIFGNNWEGEQNKCTGRAFYGGDYTPVLETSDEVVPGRFVRTSGNHYVWKTMDGNVATKTIKLDNRMEYHRVYFRVTKCFRWRNMQTGSNPGSWYERDLFAYIRDTEEQRRNILMGYVNGGPGGYQLTAKTATTQTQIVGSQAKYTVVSDVVRSGDHISKGDLLNFDGTPCDYLLSYCKLFNLYLSKDPYEKKIYIRTRDTFYNGGVVDLDQFIDRSKEIKVSPLAMESRWYDFAYPEDEKCGAAEDYDKNYGVEYGKNKVQTTYEFDSAAKNLFDDNIYQNGVQVQESSKYYTLRTVSGSPHSTGIKTVPTFLYNAVEYKLFSSPNETLSSCVILPPSAYTQTGYTSADSKEDWLPKLQLNNGNDPLDGTNILCFYGGFESSPKKSGQQVIYYLTDDLAEMYVLNGETPCWLWTKEEKNGSQIIAKGMTKLPVFSRMLYGSKRGQKVIQYTWDFGRVRNTYVPVKKYLDKSTIFERWWSKYISDIYNANTRVVEAYVKMEGKVVGDWLRAMYWWDNCYWVLTEINDYNITSYATTRCKFVKVNDIANYTDGIVPPTAVTPTATIVPAKYIIASTGETITARVVTNDGGAWHIECPSYVHPSQSAGTGDLSITLRFDANPNSDGRDISTSAVREGNTTTLFWQEGTESTEKQILVSSNRLILNYGQQTNNAITITYRNREADTVTISSNAVWLTASITGWNGNDATLVISAEENTGTTVRSATVTISGVSFQGSATVTIDQLPEEYTISNNGGSVSSTLLNPFSVTALNGYWAVIRTTGTTVIFSASTNTGETTRYETVRFTVDGGITSSATTQIVQAGGGGSLVVSPTSITADYIGGDKIMTVNATGNWSASSVPNWVSLSQTAGTSGQSAVIVTFSENTGESIRAGSFTITDGTRTATVNLSQNYHIVQHYLQAAPSSLSYDYVGGTSYVNINSSANWSATSKPDWVTLSIESGMSGTSIIGVDADMNMSTESGRSGNITFSNGTDTLSLPVSQAQKIIQRRINVTPDSLYFDYTGDTKYITVASEDYNWSLVSKPNWVILSQNSGQTGYTMVSVEAGQNDGTTTRTGEIIFTDGAFNVSVAVGQAASSTTKTLTLSPSLLYVENSGGTPIIHIAYGNRNGDDVNITSSESWVHPSYAQWTGETGNIVLTVDSYGVNMERVATITATSVLDPTLSTTMTVRQKALPYITLNPSFIEFDQTGGTATITLESNTDWIIDITDTE